MRIAYTCLLLLTTSLFVSCQKDDGLPESSNSASNILGSYKFVSMNIKSEASSEFEGSKTISTTEYTTTNNKGTFVIDPSTITTTDISYDISSSMTSRIYQNGTLVTEMISPFVWQAQPSSATGAYERVGSDSLYMPDGATISIAGSPAVNQSAPNAMKFKVSGNLLILTGSQDQIVTETFEGMPFSTAVKLTMVTTLEKN